MKQKLAMHLLLTAAQDTKSAGRVKSKGRVPIIRSGIMHIIGYFRAIINGCICYQP
jgi:hypothetical protein